jgi:hypothetical protein
MKAPLERNFANYKFFTTFNSSIFMISMRYDFEKFLHNLEKNCKTKAEIVEQLHIEIEFVKKNPIDDGDYVLKDIYLKHLQNAKSYFERGITQSSDKYNKLLFEIYNKF